MPRIRSIKPQFWLNETLGKLPHGVRLLYIGLWNLSDDTGVFEWRPSRIRVQLFPYDNDVTDEVINQWLEILMSTQHVAKFSDNGNQFGYIPTFLKHQDIQKPSKWCYAQIPKELLTSHLPITNLSHNNNDESPNNHSPVTLGSRLYGVGSKESGVGSKEKEVVVKNAFEKIKGDLSEEFRDIDFESELKKCIDWWSDERKQLKKPRLALRNWMVNARKFKNEHPDKQATSKFNDGWK